MDDKHLLESYWLHIQADMHIVDCSISVIGICIPKLMKSEIRSKKVQPMFNLLHSRFFLVTDGKISVCLSVELCFCSLQVHIIYRISYIVYLSGIYIYIIYTVYIYITYIYIYIIYTVYIYHIYISYMMAKKNTRCSPRSPQYTADRLEDARLLGHAYDGDLWCARWIRRRSSHRNHWDLPSGYLS